jgi:perosamine synthetase
MNKLLINKNKSILIAVKTINDNAKGIVFVTDDQDKLCGVITDGDVRRALLNDIKLDEKISTLISDKYIFGYKDDKLDVLMSKVSDRVKIIPLVDKEQRVVDYFEYKQNMYFPVAVPNLGGNEFKYLFDAFASTWISSSGKYIGIFESQFSAYSDCAYGVAVSNGTVAIHLALETLGIGKGDEVIVPDLTFAATINAVIHTNATPVIVDIEEDSWCIDPVAIEKAISPKTKAIVPVHLYGQPCNMEAIMCVTNDKALDDRMRVLRDHGMSKTKKYWHDHVGYNYRITNLQAAIGVAQLERVDEIHRNRKIYENSYKEALKPGIVKFQKDLPDRHRITWLVSVLLDDGIDRDEFMQKLKKIGIDARPFFYPMSDMDIYKKYNKLGTPVTKKISKQGINLPTYELLQSAEDITNILKTLEI